MHNLEEILNNLQEIGSKFQVNPNLLSAIEKDLRSGNMCSALGQINQLIKAHPEAKNYFIFEYQQTELKKLGGASN